MVSPTLLEDEASRLFNNRMITDIYRVFIRLYIADKMDIFRKLHNRFPMRVFAWDAAEKIVKNMWSQYDKFSVNIYL